MSAEQYSHGGLVATPGSERNDAEPVPPPNVQSLKAHIGGTAVSPRLALEIAWIIHQAGWHSKVPPPAPPPISARDAAVEAIRQLRCMMDADKSLCLLDAAGKELRYFKLVRRETVNVTEFKS